MNDKTINCNYHQGNMPASVGQMEFSLNIAKIRFYS